MTAERAFHLRSTLFFSAFLSILFFTCARSQSTANATFSFTKDAQLVWADKTLETVDSIRQFGEDLFIFSRERGLLLPLKNEFQSLKDFPVSPARNLPRQLMDFYPSQTNGPHFLLFRHQLWTYDSEKNWRQFEMKGIRRGSRLSAIHKVGDDLYLSAAYNGIYRYSLKDGGEWKKLSSGLEREKYSWQEYFYSPIDRIWSVEDSTYAFNLEFQRIYHLSNDVWQPHLEGVQEVLPLYDETGSALIIKNKKLFRLLPSGKLSTELAFTLSEKYQFEKGQWSSIAPFVNSSLVSEKRVEAKAEVPLRSLYVNLDYVTSAGLKLLAKMLAAGEYNAVVVNFKDDTGNLVYGSTNAIARQARALRKHYKLDRFLKTIEPYDPHFIVRQVVFKDYRMHHYQSNAYAIWDKENKKAWRINDIEYWVDPFSEFIRDYNVAVAREISERAEEWGVDEIQFDYIRLPSDRALSRAEFRHREAHWERYDVLIDFLNKAHQVVSLPLSVDIYGYNAIYPMGNVIGQDIETISRYASTICPMFYPSHFGGAYLNDEPHQAYHVLQYGTERAGALVQDATLIRPYLQAFDYRAPDFGGAYVAYQMKGVADGKGEGLGFWHPGGNYHLLDKAMRELSPEDYLKYFPNLTE